MRQILSWFLTHAPDYPPRRPRVQGLSWSETPCVIIRGMSESEHLPMNFGGIEDEELSSFERARVVVWPVSYEGTVSYGGGTGAGAEAVVDASRNMELYDEETDAEVYRLGIHTTEVTPPAA